MQKLTVTFVIGAKDVYKRQVMNIDLEIHKFIPSTISNPIFEYIYNTIETLYNKNIEFRHALGPSWDDIPLEHPKAFLLNLINGILSRDIATVSYTQLECKNNPIYGISLILY